MNSSYITGSDTNRAGSKYPAAKGGGSVTATAENGQFDLSMDRVPAHWKEAQADSPTAAMAVEGPNPNARFSAIPAKHGSSFIPNAVALGASFVSGAAWFVVEFFEVYQGPWIAVLVGAVIATFIRMAADTEPAYNAVLAVGAYLLTLLVVLIFVTHQELTDIYGSVGDFQIYEQTLVRTRLQDPVHLLAYGLGAVVASQIAYRQMPKRS